MSILPGWFSTDHFSQVAKPPESVPPTTIVQGRTSNLIFYASYFRLRQMNNIIVPEEAGPSVTKNKIRGEEHWFPDISSLFNLNDPLLDESPRHMVLLTAGESDAFLRLGPGNGDTEPLGTGKGVMVCTDEAIVGASSSTGFFHSGDIPVLHIRIPYEEVTTVLGSPGPSGFIDISTGGEIIRFNIAKNADSSHAVDVYKYILDIV